ncbi:glucuronide transporter [Noviherbaspirillum aerium]|uniref:glucuronide transporter n=1 Tax=Noviherbaspirillum aerium TaxID=2588497 RepID=UPI00124DF68E|nr:glucuronide transporter [Noviherbaspirillum aerium]
MHANKPLQWHSIVGYGLGDAANNLAFAISTLFLLSYYTDVAGIEAGIAGTILVTVRIYDAFMDLLAGHVVDRTSTRWGRFRPFLLWGSPPLMLLSVAVFSVPLAWSENEKLAYACVTYVLFGTAYSFVNIPYGSLATAMTQDPRDRARLGASRSLMAVLTFGILTAILGRTASEVNAALIQEKLADVTMILAIVGMAFHAICFKTTSEVVHRKPERPPFGDSLRTLARNRPLQMLCLSALCILLGYASSGAAMVYFARDIYGDLKQFMMFMGAMTVGTALVSAFLVPHLVFYIGKKHTLLLGLVIGIAGYVVLLSVAETNQSWILLAMVIASLGVRLIMSIMWALEADTVEYGEWTTGVRIEGLTYSIFSFTRKCGYALGGSIPAFLLSAGGYVPNAADQNDAVMHGIVQAVALLPALSFSAAFAIMLFYPLTDRYFARMLDDMKTGNGSR